MTNHSCASCWPHCWSMTATTSSPHAMAPTAWKSFPRETFDLVILDRAMPGMNGDELALNLHRTSPDIPVIMLTGFGSLMSASGECPIGVHCTLSKPITHKELRAAIADVVGPARASARVDRPAAG